MGMENIRHVVVVMMENRSFDNLLGWLYADADNKPLRNIPIQSRPSFDGLKANAYSNLLDASMATPVFASRPPRAWPPACPHPAQVPTPDPHEEFEHVTRQLFGESAPAPGVAPTMSGFLQNYSTTEAGVECAAQIMHTFGPAEAPVINTLARNFAVCDRWFSSAPTQTWPNRGFVHTGSSDGHIDNEHYEPYGNRTIFNVLSDQGVSWGVYHDTTYVPSLTHIQFTQLWDHGDHFHPFRQFESLCASDKTVDPSRCLPAYSFIEPRFVPEPGEWWRLFLPRFPSDFHPPHDVARGERFLARVYNSVRKSPYRDEILLIVTFDEHGGCFDHVPPPWGSAPPQPGSVARKNGFTFDRFGVRVPTLLISSYVEPGTVFREAPGATPYDHTSILATLRDWLNLGRTPGQFLPSPRIDAAPTLHPILTRGADERRMEWPRIRSQVRLIPRDASRSTQLTGLQKGILAHKRRMESSSPTEIGNHLAEVEARIPSYAEALKSIRADARKTSARSR